jgi:hypothetical protein
MSKKKSKKMSEKELNKVKKRFQDFFEEEDNQLNVFNTVLNVSSEILPDVDATNPAALQNVAANPDEPFENRLFALLILLFLLTIIFSAG